MKGAIKKIIKPFLPKYEVVFTTYQIIPGKPVNQNHSRHSFDRGAEAEARAFYSKVVSSEFTKTLVPAEVQLRRIYLKGTTIEKAEFGPVNDLRKFKVVSNG